jgi:hypothetical protein
MDLIIITTTCMSQSEQPSELAPSHQNNHSNIAPDFSSSIYRLELTPQQANYLTRLLPTNYSFQLDAKIPKRTSASQKNLKE